MARTISSITNQHLPADVAEVFKRLKKRFGKVETALHYQKPHQLCVAVILSAQCTDARVNLVTPELFRVFPEPIDLANAPTNKVEELIFTTGFYKNKARNIKGFCRSLVEDHNGLIPKSIAELIKMPGVGRKTANVILQEIYGISDGFVVDTHVLRVSRRLGFSTATDAVKMERDLMKLIPKKNWAVLSLYMIYLGRQTCVARKPKCFECELSSICPSSTAR
ncbi:MAG: endonuclease III [Leptonema sp. (in: Bacteria)]|nr:endonuclease III [Leptonema sp. (in: bacteria)]